ncbi:MAG: translocation/assembly module TamB domain-containing protein, partial [Bacteroidota bacterium]
INGNKDQSYIDFGAFHTVLNNKTHFAPLYFISYINQDTVNFNINATNFTNVLDNVNLNGKFYFLEDYMQITFLPSNLVLLNENWDIDENNYVRFRKDYIETNNFELRNGDRIINLTSKGDKGLVFNLKNLDIDFVNGLWTYDKLVFNGNVEVKAEAADIFKLEGLTADISIDTFWVNGDDWGALNIHGDADNINKPVNSYLTVVRGERNLTGKGFYVPPTRESRMPGKKFPANYFAYTISMDNYPLDIVEYFIGHSVSNTVGTVEADVTLKGTPRKPVLRGDAMIRNGAITIDYLGTRYYINDQKAKINEYIFDASGSVITDSLGNEAYVTGGIIHDHFKNWGLDARVFAPRFVALDTKKGDNELYYGYGIGQGDVRFSGTFQQTNIDIEAITAKGTQLNIPIDYGSGSTNRGFVTFVDADGEEEETVVSQLRGINLDMNLQVTDDAEVQLIFDEQQGDIIKGRGTGDLQLIVDRRGDLNMYGDYVISSGNYLFTFPQLFISKPFDVKQGGVIRWDGDPFDARINLEANYDGLSVSPYSFLSDLGLTFSDNEDLRNPTKVELTMFLDGALLKPNINFGLAFPALSGDARGLVEQRLEILKNNQNEINRQVFGLLVFGTFLPNGTGITSDQLLSPVVNTLSEMLSNQLSRLISEMVASSIDPSGVLSGVDLQTGFDIFSGNDASESMRLDGWEIQIKPKVYLFKDRIALAAGLTTGQFDSDTYIRPDILFEARLSQDSRWRLFVYHRAVFNLNQQNNKTGGGIRYQRDFDTWRELFNRKPKKKEKPQVQDLGPFPPPPVDSTKQVNTRR